VVKGANRGSHFQLEKRAIPSQYRRIEHCENEMERENKITKLFKMAIAFGKFSSHVFGIAAF
jgi:hypothetical protein